MSSTTFGFVRINPRDLDRGNLDEIIVGQLVEGEGIDDSFALEWTMIADRPCVSIRSYADQWVGMAACGPVLEAIASIRPGATIDDHPSVDEVIARLLEMGWQDQSRPPRFPRAGDPE